MNFLNKIENAIRVIEDSVVDFTKESKAEDTLKKAEIYVKDFKLPEIGVIKEVKKIGKKINSKFDEILDSTLKFELDNILVENPYEDDVCIQTNTIPLQDAIDKHPNTISEGYLKMLHGKPSGTPREIDGVVLQSYKPWTIEEKEVIQNEMEESGIMGDITDYFCNVKDFETSINPQQFLSNLTDDNINYNSSKILDTIDGNTHTRGVETVFSHPPIKEITSSSYNCPYSKHIDEVLEECDEYKDEICMSTIDIIYNLKEYYNFYYIEVLCPGIFEDDIKITTNGNDLIIKYEMVDYRDIAHEFLHRGYHITKNDYNKVLQMPTDAILCDMEKEYHNGEIFIKIPKNKSNISNYWTK